MNYPSPSPSRDVRSEIPPNGRATAPAAGPPVGPIPTAVAAGAVGALREPTGAILVAVVLAGVLCTALALGVLVAVAKAKDRVNVEVNLFNFR